MRWRETERDRGEAAKNRDEFEHDSLFTNPKRERGRTLHTTDFPAERCETFALAHASGWCDTQSKIFRSVVEAVAPLRQVIEADGRATSHCRQRVIRDADGDAELLIHQLVQTAQQGSAAG